MKKLLLLTGILLCSATGYATTDATPTGCVTGVCEIEHFLPQDSVKKRVPIKKTGLKKVELKKSDNLELVDLKDEGKKPIDGELKIDKEDIKANNSPAIEKPKFVENKSTAEEMKSMAKRESNNAKKSPTKPAVSYPSYPGGNYAIREFVRKHQQYPEECKRERLRGRVEVIIAIAPDGTPHSAAISKSSGNVYMDAEALRIADLMPKWTPAGESDDPQGTECVIFVNFRPGR